MKKRRPTLTRDQRFVFRLAEEEARHFARLATSLGMTQSYLVRLLINAADQDSVNHTLAGKQWAQRLPAKAP